MDAERRQVTVLFTDMVGFTSFSERSGEEAAFTLMRSLAKLMEDVVSEQGGVVQGFTGDGVMAVFGASVALEDAPGAWAPFPVEYKRGRPKKDRRDEVQLCGQALFAERQGLLKELGELDLFGQVVLGGIVVHSAIHDTPRNWAERSATALME